MKFFSRILTVAACLCIALSGAVPAQAAEGLGAAANNPIANMVSFPMQFNWNNGVGPDDQTLFNLNLQPVIPFGFETVNVIMRAIVPVLDVPQGGTDSSFGLGDTQLQLYWVPAKPTFVTWGLGPMFNLPTASNPDELGSGKFGVGPGGILLIQPGQWTFGLMLNNIWSVAGDADRPDTNQLTAQYFINRGLGRAWTIGTGPTITANWEADSGNQWTIPWGLNVSKITRFGDQPIQAQLSWYNNGVHPDGAAETQVQFMLKFLWPTGK